MKKKHLLIFAAVLVVTAAVSFGVGYYTYALQVQRIFENAGFGARA